MTRKDLYAEVKAVKEMTVVNVMDLLRRGKIDNSTKNQEVLNMVWNNLPAHAVRLSWENLEKIVKMNCVDIVFKNDRGRLVADVKRDASGLTYEAIEGDIIVTQLEGDETSEYGIVLPSEDNIND